MDIQNPNLGDEISSFLQDRANYFCSIHKQWIKELQEDRKHDDMNTQKKVQWKKELEEELVSSRYYHRKDDDINSQKKKQWREELEHELRHHRQKLSFNRVM
ncbi:hypothetical protein M5689_013100 [Euphorbia peplus]|nr:hypothetical protein M5689_013100 [Euphorbia peplus]